MTDKDATQKQGGKKSDSRKPTDFTEHRSKQDIPVKKSYNSIIDTHPPPDEKPKK